MATPAELLRLQRKAERQLIAGYEPEFELDSRRLDALAQWSRTEATATDVDRALAARRRDSGDLAALLSPVASTRIEEERLPLAHADLKVSFIGLVALQDPVRPAVPAAVAECRQAGIRVVMILPLPDGLIPQVLNVCRGGIKCGGRNVFAWSAFGAAGQNHQRKQNGK